MPTVRGVSVACAVALGVYALWAGTSLSGQAAAPFIDVTSESGLDFAHVNGAEGGLLLPEVIGSGGALFDYDNDGDLDLFAVQGSGLSALGSAKDVQSPGSRLFRNDLTVAPDGARALRFTDVTKASGIVATGYGMGAATGDFDNDGWIDLYVTNLGSNQLLRNNGNGTFSDVTAKGGADDPRWSTSATFFDYDRDGWLDLFVANYVNFRPDMKRNCFSAGSARDYCNPAVYNAVPDKLLHNNRDGTFSDVSSRSAIGRASGRGPPERRPDRHGLGWAVPARNAVPHDDGSQDRSDASERGVLPARGRRVRGHRLERRGRRGSGVVAQPASGARCDGGVGRPPVSGPCPGSGRR